MRMNVIVVLLMSALVLSVHSFKTRPDDSGKTRPDDSGKTRPDDSGDDEHVHVIDDDGSGESDGEEEVIEEPTEDPSLADIWNKFKARFRKRYNDRQEENNRRGWFRAAIKFIQRHNLEADLGKHTFSLGLNEFADLSSDEFRQRMNGARRPVNASRSSGYRRLRRSQLPDSVDWRDKGIVSEVKDQGSCGSCWSFAATGALEGQQALSSGHLVSQSEQNLVDCSTKRYGNYGCDGGWYTGAWNYIRDSGINSEQDYPYKGQQGQCRYDNTASVATCSSYVELPLNSEYDLQLATAEVGPIAVAIDASRPTYQFYKSGVYYNPFCSTTEVDHAVLVVGYGNDPDSGRDYWLVKNSWGTSWGMDGYIAMTRNNNNQCCIACYPAYPEV